MDGANRSQRIAFSSTRTAGSGRCSRAARRAIGKSRGIRRKVARARTARRAGSEIACAADLCRALYRLQISPVGADPIRRYRKLLSEGTFAGAGKEKSARAHAAPRRRRGADPRTAHAERDHRPRPKLAGGNKLAAEDTSD